MTRSLPPDPSLRFLHEEAKDLLKAQRRKDPAACPTLRLLRRFRDAGDDDILIGDLDKQRAHAETVLMPIRDDLAEAAEAFQNAVAQDQVAGRGRSMSRNQGAKP